jgi:hypothetical protein
MAYSTVNQYELVGILSKGDGWVPNKANKGDSVLWNKTH